MKNLETANRCLNCKNARCVSACPIHTPIPEVILDYKEGRYEQAGKRLFDNNPLSAICSIVCPHEKQCRGNCIRGIKGEPVDFPAIENEISMHYLKHVHFTEKRIHNQRVGIIGGGPAGITIALQLAQKGYPVTIFDAHPRIGGVLRYGIPDFRLPRAILDLLEEKLLELGVKIRPNTLIGPVLTIDRLLEDGYDALFIGTGVWNPRTLNIPGESLGNVHYAIDYLKDPEVYQLGKKVAVIGAGDVAMDAARTASRHGCDVTILYRKGKENISATEAELQGAIDDGVKFVFYKIPKACSEEGMIVADCEVVMDADGHPQSVEKADSDHLFACDSIIIAVSQLPKNNIVRNTTGLETGKNGLLIADEDGKTTRVGVFASGDVVTGAKTVVKAVKYAQHVAGEIEAYLQAKAQ